ncbi:MAG: CHAT domain-containing protein [Deltaproteobacteria bacterium]|nr:CHAT domain-containing protein [Deltaproteobacteria bacterium]
MTIVDHIVNNNTSPDPLSDSLNSIEDYTDVEKVNAFGDLVAGFHRFSHLNALDRAGLGMAIMFLASSVLEVQPEQHENTIAKVKGIANTVKKILGSIQFPGTISSQRSVRHYSYWLTHQVLHLRTDTEMIIDDDGLKELLHCALSGPANTTPSGIHSKLIILKEEYPVLIISVLKLSHMDTAIQSLWSSLNPVISAGKHPPFANNTMEYLKVGEYYLYGDWNNRASILKLASNRASLDQPQKQVLSAEADQIDTQLANPSPILLSHQAAPLECQVSSDINSILSCTDPSTAKATAQNSSEPFSAKNVRYVLTRLLHSMKFSLASEVIDRQLELVSRNLDVNALVELLHYQFMLSNWINDGQTRQRANYFIAYLKHVYGDRTTWHGLGESANFGILDQNNNHTEVKELKRHNWENLLYIPSDDNPSKTFQLYNSHLQAIKLKLKSVRSIKTDAINDLVTKMQKISDSNSLFHSSEILKVTRMLIKKSGRGTPSGLCKLYTGLVQKQMQWIPNKRTRLLNISLNEKPVFAGYVESVLNGASTVSAGDQLSELYFKLWGGQRIYDLVNKNPGSIAVHYFINENNTSFCLLTRNNGNDNCKTDIIKLDNARKSDFAKIRECIQKDNIVRDFLRQLVHPDQALPNLIHLCTKDEQPNEKIVDLLYRKLLIIGQKLFPNSLLSCLNQHKPKHIYLSVDAELMDLPIQWLPCGSKNEPFIKNFQSSVITPAMVSPFFATDTNRTTLSAKSGNYNLFEPELYRAIMVYSSPPGNSWDISSVQDVLQAISRSQLATIITHGFDEADPARSSLALPGGLRLRRTDIESSGISFNGTTVALFACSAAYRRQTDHLHKETVADAFLAQGARGVIAGLAPLQTNLIRTFVQIFMEQSVSSGAFLPSSVFQQAAITALRTVKDDDNLTENQKRKNQLGLFTLAYYGID